MVSPFIVMLFYHRPENWTHQLYFRICPMENLPLLFQIFQSPGHPRSPMPSKQIPLGLHYGWKLQSRILSLYRWTFQNWKCANLHLHCHSGLRPQNENEASGRNSSTLLCMFLTWLWYRNKQPMTYQMWCKSQNVTTSQSTRRCVNLWNYFHVQQHE